MKLYHTTDTNGVSDVNPTDAKLKRLIASLDSPEIEDADYPDISLVHDASGWCITLFPSGVATFENLEDEDTLPRYLPETSRKVAFELWKDLAAGNIQKLKANQWKTDC